MVFHFTRQGPILAHTQPPELLNIVNEKERFKLEMELKADDVDFRSSSYKRVPIESFGRAMLLGMGWDGNSSENKEHAERVLPREARLGLGATSIKSLGELSSGGRNSKRSRTNHAEEKSLTKQIDMKLSKQSIYKGDTVILLDKSYAGKRATVLETNGLLGLNKIRVSLESSGEILEFLRNDVSLLNGTSQATQKVKDNIEGANNKSKGSDSTEKNGEATSSKGEIYGQDKKKDPSIKGDGMKPTVSGDDWLAQGIRVKVITKKLGKEIYLMKATVIDVYDKGVASIGLDSGGTVENVKSKHLETVLPKIGGLCLILRGEYKGQMATCVGRESDDVNVQNDDGELITLKPDDVAAFVQNSY